MINFDLGGWFRLENEDDSNVGNREFLEQDFEVPLEDQDSVYVPQTIKVYLDQDRVSKKEQSYWCTYTTEGRFNGLKVCQLIAKTFKKASERYANGDSAYYDNLSLTDFDFDPETNSIYPHTDS